MIDMSGWASAKKIPKAAMGRWWDTIDDPAVAPAPTVERPPLATQTRECGAMPNECGVAGPWPDHWRSR